MWLRLPLSRDSVMQSVTNMTTLWHFLGVDYMNSDAVLTCNDI